MREHGERLSIRRVAPQSDPRGVEKCDIGVSP
jgi:hypothetical protein